MRKLSMGSWRKLFWEKIDKARLRDQWDLKMHQDLCYDDPTPGWVQSVEEHARARFQCSGCGHAWSSVQVIILFHMCLDGSRRQGSVKMRVFGQKCNQCSQCDFSEPVFKAEGVDRVLEKLVMSIREKCYGESVDHSQLLEVVIGRHGGPHRSDDCEACHLGIHRKTQGPAQHGRQEHPVVSWAPPTPVPSFEPSRPSVPHWTKLLNQSFYKDYESQRLVQPSRPSIPHRTRVPDQNSGKDFESKCLICCLTVGGCFFAAIFLCLLILYIIPN
ncbi:PREDICTED: receptor-transporting protein 2-like [Crocodylus porosus]|uniref:Receptor-transporting protein 2-like n=1 Tax=Crocodylus porosus TaxID=8502 RepID=A0A7M4F157_CROPO|nr:PREDICTED: receptor-transporting protein 2-like [Crocodylus porosus]